MAHRFIDISMHLENNVQSDPPGLGPRIDYIRHEENRQDTMDATGSYVISDAYSLSKATTIYGFVGLMTAKKGATGLTSLTTAALTSGYPGANTTSIGVGIVHRF